MSEQDFPPPGVPEQLQSLLLSSPDLAEFLHQLTVMSVQVVPGPVSCGITVRYDATVLTVAASDQQAQRLDETQYRHRSGPCLQSLDTGTVVSSPDCRSEQRWPAYTTQAVREGLRCSLSLPLTAAAEKLGALNVYGFERAGMFGAAEERQLLLFAAQASGALRLAIRQHKDALLLAQLEEALNSRTVIDQAIGILIARHQLSAAAAFDLLRVQSQTTGRKLRDIAADLVTGATGAPPAPGRPFDAT